MIAMAATPVMDRLVARTTRMNRPLNVHFDLTYRCNERCVHCYLDHEDRGELTTAECLDVLEQLAAAGTLFLTFSGGEIFLRRDLFEILERARKLHFDLSLKTNALLVDSTKARRLKELGIRRVQISVYSDVPAVHDAITKAPGSLARTLAAIPLLREQGLTVKISCPLMTENVGDFRGVIQLAEELGVKYMMDMTITPMMDGNASTLAHRVPATGLLPILQDSRLGGYCSTREPAAESRSPAVTGSAVSSGMDYGGLGELTCSAGHNSCYISPYGDVYPCVQLPKAAGNLRREAFRAIWYNSPELEEVRAIRTNALPVCSRCEIQEYCDRCPGLALMEGGDLLGAYERACELAERRARLDGKPGAISAKHREQLAIA